MTAHRGITTFEEFRDEVSAYRLPRILLTALDLDLFTRMGTRAWTVSSLARRLKISPRGLEILCRNLASAGLLHKQGAVYQTGLLGRRELNARSPYYRGAYLSLLRRQWDDWSQLTRAVRRGRPVDGKTADDAAYRRDFSRAMHDRSKGIAPMVAAQLDLKRANTLLDLGGGPGTYALAFLARNPTLRATVCDRPAALEVARELAGRVTHGRRLAYLPVDFMRKPIKGRYDVIWYSNVLHIYSPEENRALFKRLVHHLTPRGRLIIQDAFTTDRHGLRPVETNLFAVTMLLFTCTGNTFAMADTGLWVRAAGFGRVRRLPLKKGTEDWEGGLVEASLPRVPRK